MVHILLLYVDINYLACVVGGAGAEHLYLGPRLLVCQFIEISNQMELNGEITNFEKIIIY